MEATVVADIGGTSSRWGVLRTGDEPWIIEGTPGFNPAVGDATGFREAVRTMFAAHDVVPGDLYVYGAGCGTPERALRMADVLLSIWPNARADISSDLMGAAHGLLGTRPGLVLILGTGMNVGRYDGMTLHQPMPSLGYILGDEGSGADIGRHFLRDAFHGRAPEEVMRAVFPQGLDAADVIERIYRGSGPQAWLASFTGALSAQRQHPYVRSLVESRTVALAELMAYYFADSVGTGVHATGSVAFGFKDILTNSLYRAGFRLSAVEQSPLPGLLRYRGAAAR
jgi:glucosamine kinase